MRLVLSATRLSEQVGRGTDVRFKGSGKQRRRSRAGRPKARCAAARCGRRSRLRRGAWGNAQPVPRIEPPSEALGLLPARPTGPRTMKQLRLSVAPSARTLPESRRRPASLETAYNHGNSVAASPRPRADAAGAGWARNQISAGEGNGDQRQGLAAAGAACPLGGADDGPSRGPTDGYPEDGEVS
jgi:hypothetical protein